MLAVVYSRASTGIRAPLVTVEAHISPGLPALSIVGLPEAAVKESKDRVRSAILNSQLDFPTRRLTINLAPADLPKEGGRFDLPIALGILSASGQIPPQALQDYEFAGELALSGELRPIQGTLPLALGTRGTGRALMVPAANAQEAALLSDLPIYPVNHLLEVYRHLTKQTPLTLYDRSEHPPSADDVTQSELDFSDIRGQTHAKRILEIAAAGGHSLLMIGPPGTGKTMLASRLPTIMPTLSQEQALEVAAVHSLITPTHKMAPWLLGQRPFRAPHHTASSVALVGGGAHPRPGEVSLAHLGILFLDELPEFDRRVLEVLREPLESGHILISRAARQAEFPARFQLVAAMNPCPCGYLGDAKGRCQCTIEQIRRYRSRISGPLLDRIDMHIEVPTLPAEQLAAYSEYTETSAMIRMRVNQAVERQHARSAKLNAALQHRELQTACPLESTTQKRLNRAMEQLGLTARSYHRVLRVARTIADLAAEPDIQMEHVSEALSLRKLDRYVKTVATSP